MTSKRPRDASTGWRPAGSSSLRAAIVVRPDHVHRVHRASLEVVTHQRRLSSSSSSSACAPVAAGAAEPRLGRVVVAHLVNELAHALQLRHLRAHAHQPAQRIERRADRMR